MRHISLQHFERIIPTLCDEKTSADPAGWTKANPLWGHCAVVALLVQEMFGGEILRASLLEIPEFAQMRSHYWNRLPNGTEIDVSRSQFGQQYPTLVGEPKDRHEILNLTKNPDTVRRYDRLRLRMVAELSGQKIIGL